MSNHQHQQPEPPIPAAVASVDPQAKHFRTVYHPKHPGDLAWAISLWVVQGREGPAFALFDGEKVTSDERFPDVIQAELDAYWVTDWRLPVRPTRVLTPVLVNAADDPSRPHPNPTVLASLAIGDRVRIGARVVNPLNGRPHTATFVVRVLALGVGSEAEAEAGKGAAPGQITTTTPEEDPFGEFICRPQDKLLIHQTNVLEIL